jgi:hypothetical protein
MRPADCLATLDRRFWAHALAWSIGSLLALGIVSAIVPNPVFGRQIAAEPFAIAVWLLSAPLVGIVGATYTSPQVRGGSAVPLAMPASLPPSDDEDRGASLLGSVAGLGAFLAIGCPVCNKVAVVLLGTSGALGVWAPIQPFLGAISLVLLAATAAWRLRVRARGGACAVITA